VKEIRDVRITVLQRTTNQRLIEKYGDSKIEHLCPYNEEGQEFISVEGAKPDGFCEEVWTAFGKYAFALAHGVERFWPSWIEARHIAISSCNDGLRPVIFKFEPVDKIKAR
jgi:uncharacterized repeat protein (TIGR04076 family)